MDFLKALSQIMQIRKVKEKRKKGTRIYYSSGQIHLSRLFAYKQVGDRFDPDERYAPAIRTLFNMLAAGMTLPEVKQALDRVKYRDSSNNRYSIARIMALVRPIYAGYIEQRGRMIEVKNLTPILTLEVYRKAERQVRLERRKLVDQ
jgi:hypothetical protein